MAGFKFLSLGIAATFLLANQAQAQAPPEDDTGAANTATQVNCLAEMNAARTLAGLPEFKLGDDTASLLPITTKDPSRSDEKQPNSNYLKQVCDGMKGNRMACEQGNVTVDTIKPEGTYAYAVQDQYDCQAAVDQWKKAFTNFDGLPPAYKGTESPYTNAQNISLISLFNPKENPKVDCAHFTCPATTGGLGAGRNGEEKELKALLCVTTPQALTEGQPPYTQDQWNKINTAINSGSAAIPTVFAVSAAAVAALFLFLSLATAATLLLAKQAQAQAQPQGSSDATNTATQVNCLAEMNEARGLAGFPELKLADDEKSLLPITKQGGSRSDEKQPNTDYLKQVCDDMKAGKTTVEGITPDGTYAYAVQDQYDCQAAVDQWKKAFTNFNGLPPDYDSKASPYTDAQNVSLISLFNPKENPKVDCAHFTCPATAGGVGTERSGEEKVLKALLCVTTPQALTAGQPPYTQDQWNKINTAVNSGSAAIPTLFAVGAAAVAALFLDAQHLTICTSPRHENSYVVSVRLSGAYNPLWLSKMAGFKFLSLATAATFLLTQQAQAQGEDERVNCLAEMNAARSLAGLPELKLGDDTGSLLPITTKGDSDSDAESPNERYLKQVCADMKGGKATVEKITPDGTYAYAVQDQYDCQAAVDQWKKAFSNFNGLPPAYESTASLYTNAQNVSLISLFNPKEDPKVDCAHFTCPAATQGSDQRTGTEKELKALLCITTPQALTAQQPPYTQDQWNKINTAINSGSAAIPTVFAVGAAAVAALFL
ncbi:SAG family member [Eimeria brunetti]|uniref:SAG family member n=1 Tax=Eimeria brunetti TaxID=51314 RepID=U6LS57_9EIME|nr:SAG family member [Eimeria brunetti]